MSATSSRSSRTAGFIAAALSVCIAAGCGDDSGAGGGGTTGGNACSLGSSTCTVDLDCCSNDCREGSCACGTDLHDCAGPADCCSGVCEEGTCVGGTVSCSGIADCDACFDCAALSQPQGPCYEQVAACSTPLSLSDPTGLCEGITACYEVCGGDSACSAQCDANYPEAREALYALWDCVFCQQCPTSCVESAAAVCP